MFVCYLSSYILSAEDLEDPVRELVMQPDIAICGLESMSQKKTVVNKVKVMIGVVEILL